MALDEKTVDWKHVGKDARTIVNEILGAKKFRYMGEADYLDIQKEENHVYGLKLDFANLLVVRDETENKEIYPHPLNLNDFYEIK